MPFYKHTVCQNAAGFHIKLKYIGLLKTALSRRAPRAQTTATFWHSARDKWHMGRAVYIIMPTQRAHPASVFTRA